MKFAKKQLRGFSLIEILIVMAIIGVAATVSWKSVSNAKQQTLVDNACDGVAVMVNKARAYALAGVDGANRVRVNCSMTSCQIQSYNSNDFPGSLANIDSAYVLQKTRFVADPLPIVYKIPYATETGRDETHTIQVIGNDDITKDLITNKFKATCQ